MKRRQFLEKGFISLASLKALEHKDFLQAREAERAPIEIQNDFVKYVIGNDGQNLHFVDKRTGDDYCARSPISCFARIKKAGQEFNASAVSYADGQLAVHFGKSEVSALLKVITERHYFILEVLSVSDAQVEEMAFFDLQLTLRGSVQDPFAGSALALNLKTNVPELPRANSRLRALCYPRFGFAGAKAAIIGCPQAQLRQVMKEVVQAAEDLPHSPVGGPWAMEPKINRGSYLFNFGNLSEETVDGWIRLVQGLGLNQIDFHGGKSFRFGDCRPNPETYPRGRASLRAVIDKLHKAGIAAGLHTYSFFMDKSCPWVTPIPDPRLANDATFTLATPLTAESATVSVIEPTKDMSTITGFFVRNSVTLQIEDELITYSGVSKESPYGFSGCKRAAYGTRAASHRAGAKAHHLKECFGLFVPDGDSTLLAEVAGKTAEMFNECGFDMIYLDALDGEDILGGSENGWHYGSKLVFEIWKRLKKPAVMEMSTFHHHLWYVRSRYEAWDVPSRSYKKFIDLHCAANEDSSRMFLPGEMGWWNFRGWTGVQQEPMFGDDIEYLCGKCLGAGSGLALMGVDPESTSKKPVSQRLGAILKRYEHLRQSNYFPDSIKAKLRVPGDEFTLIQNSNGEWQFRPVQYAKHKVQGIDNWSNVWRTKNKFGQQPLQLRIETLMSAGPYDAPGNVAVADFSDARDFHERASESGITADLHLSSAQVKVQPVSGCYSALNTQAKREGTWTKVGKIFSPPLDLSRNQALGVWVYGDGQGEVLNFQLRNPEHISFGIGEHYVMVDFTGWRYFELIEPEGERYANYSWPYGSTYSVYFFSVDYGHLESLSMWYNNLPPGKHVTCYLSPIKALPLVKTKLSNPALTINKRTLIFPGEIESGCYLEFHSLSDCKLYGPEMELLAEVKPQGEVPVLEEGDNEVSLTCDAPAGVSPRANVTVISQGAPLRE
jgi:hypothetical protein